MTPEAIEAAARALHRFNAPRVANDIEPWDQVPSSAQARWRKQAELALMAAAETVPSEPADPFARLSRPNIQTSDEPPPLSQAALGTVAEFLAEGPDGSRLLSMKDEACGRTRMPPGGPMFWCSDRCESGGRHVEPSVPSVAEAIGRRQPYHGEAIAADIAGKREQR